MIKNVQKCLYFVILIFIISSCSKSTQGLSIARQWNEVLLNAIRSDFARPTVHARNLFHFSAASYDAWAVYADKESTYLLGREVSGFACEFENIDQFFSQTDIPANKFLVRDYEAQRAKAISYANFRLLLHRFRFSPGFFSIRNEATELMEALGYDYQITDTDYSSGDAAALGNYIAECYIAFGLQDGANEQNNYANEYYKTVNPTPIRPAEPGNPGINDINRWQVIELENSIDQAGQPVSSAPPFLSPEWGQVVPFSLKEADKTVYRRDGFDYQVYFDPGPPPKMTDTPLDESSQNFKQTFAMVAVWSSHLSSSDDKTIDISPASTGNVDINTLPSDFSFYGDFYDYSEGGDSGTGHELNPVTGQPYEPQLVKRGDYARILAEFWADGPDSETPPGHWFTIINYVNDHPLLERKLAGVGKELGKLEWDVKSYFILGGAMHDVAIASWGIKGWYDYVRPVSAIRAMADLGQSSDPNLVDSYNERGLPLHEGYIEVVESGDPLAGVDDVNVNKIKLKAWRGPDYINNPELDEAGVGWILAENWWPYQRPTFVTPPFAGYVSGHSTYSRAAAEVLTALTGSRFFPGGLGEFEARKNEFLVFEEGPSKDITLQWATYQDASDQCSLSRIWGGIHPPVDDLNGRRIGEKIGKQAFEFANSYFNLD